MIEKKDKKYLKVFFILAYLVFWLLLALTGYIISLGAPLLIQNIMKNISAAAPTLVIILMFRKLYPNITFKEYLKIHFTKKLKPEMLVSSFLLQILVAVIAVLAFLWINKKPLNTITLISTSSILPAFIMSLTSGALGEELGWRGYALNTLQKKYIPLSSGLIIGTIWGLWHFPLMILSGYSNVNMVYYILAFMVGITSLSIVITFFYNRTKNILIAMWIHFWFNFLLSIIIMDLLSLLIYTSVGYLILAILVVLFNRDEFFLIKSAPVSNIKVENSTDI